MILPGTLLRYTDKGAPASDEVWLVCDRYIENDQIMLSVHCVMIENSWNDLTGCYIYTEKSVVYTIDKGFMKVLST